MNRLLRLANASPVGQRLVSGFGANLLAKIWIMLVQIVSVPSLTASWGVEGFGVWLMITTIPSYLAISDFGLATAAGVDMTQSIAKDDHPSALRSFQTIWVFISTVSCGVAALIGIGFAIWLGFESDAASSTFSAQEIFGAAIFVIFGALLSAQTSVMIVVYQATHKYALGHFINGFSFPLQGAAAIIVAMSGGGFVAAAAAAACAAGIILLICSRVLARLEPWARVGTANADRATLKRLFRPSLAAFALTAANSFGLQGIVITIGWAMGPAVAAVFATARMISRVPLQFSMLAARASLPEFTRAYASGDHRLATKLMKVNLALASAVMIPSVLGLIIFGPKVLTWLSSGTMDADQMTFGLLGLAALLNVLWATHGFGLLATNRQGEYAWLVLVLYGVVAIAPFFATNLIFILLVAALFELIILLRTTHLSGIVR